MIRLIAPLGSFAAAHTWRLGFLALADQGEEAAEPLVFEHGRLGGTPQFVEGPIGHTPALEADLQSSVGEIHDFDRLANAILAEPAFAQDRVVLIEDTAELQCSAEDKIQMLTKRTDPSVTMTDLVRDTLLRPDRIIIGEVRNGSALDLLKAWNTGHPGGLATIHANSAAEGMTRLEDLIGEVTQRIPYRATAGSGDQPGCLYRADGDGAAG